MNSPATRTTHALLSSFSSPPPFQDPGLRLVGESAVHSGKGGFRPDPRFPGSSQMNYDSQNAIRCLARAEKPFLSGGKQGGVVAKPFGGCSFLGLHARACLEPMLELARRWALGPRKEWLGARSVAGMGWGKFTAREGGQVSILKW